MQYIDHASDLTGIFADIENRSYEKHECFLCGSKQNITDEHFIPKWLQNKLDLWNHKITLLNGYKRKYSQLKIPCCIDCNNTHLSRVETDLSKAFEAGYDSVKNLDREKLFLWLSKIYFGLLYSELFLKSDPSSPTSDHILKSEVFSDSLYITLLSLQGYRNRHSFKDFSVSSIFIFKLNPVDDGREDWDLIDNFNKPFISIRINDVGIIACLQDCCFLDDFTNIGELQDSGLNQYQFIEVVAHTACCYLLLETVPLFMSVQDASGNVSTYLTKRPLKTLPWDNELFLKLFATYLREDVTFVKPDSDNQLSFLGKQMRNLLFSKKNDSFN